LAGFTDAERTGRRPLCCRRGVQLRGTQPGTVISHGPDGIHQGIGGRNGFTLIDILVDIHALALQAEGARAKTLLLHDMGQLVGQETTVARHAGFVLAPGEHDVVTDRKGPSPHCGSGLVCFRTGMDSDAAEIEAKAGFHPGTHGSVQRPAISLPPPRRDDASLPFRHWSFHHHPAARNDTGRRLYLAFEC
jgi:hypothetical protein